MIYLKIVEYGKKADIFKFDTFDELLIHANDFIEKNNIKPLDDQGLGTSVGIAKDRNFYCFFADTHNLTTISEKSLIEMFEKLKEDKKREMSGFPYMPINVHFEHENLLSI
jgi:hypothetical protein